MNTHELKGASHWALIIRNFEEPQTCILLKVHTMLSTIKPSSWQTITYRSIKKASRSVLNDAEPSAGELVGLNIHARRRSLLLEYREIPSVPCNLLLTLRRSRQSLSALGAPTPLILLLHGLNLPISLRRRGRSSMHTEFLDPHL